MIDIQHTGPAKLRKTELSPFLREAQQAAGLRGRVDVLLADDATLRRLNREFRHKDAATDVLSFPALANEDKVAGDVAISLEAAQRQAAQHGHSLEAEVKILLLHGVLHLAGHDHESDNGNMRRLEEKLRVAFGLPAALIERAATKRRKRA
jgi:probable rRNA maturation factor